MKKLSLLSLTFVMALTGCASIVSKSTRPVTITSNPTGANFVVKKESGMAISTGVTPATIVLNCSLGYFQPARYIVEYTRKGVTQTVPLTASLNGWYIGNIPFGGLIGLLIVDPATGAMWKLDETVIANFNQTADNKKPSSKLMICTINSIPKEWNGHLVALK